MVFAMPWCLACAILAALFCSASGITIQRPLRMMLFLCASNSSVRLLWGLRLRGCSLYIPLLVFVLDRLVVGALDGG